MGYPRKLIRLAKLAAAYYRRKESVDEMPIRLWIETTNRCNLRCPMCPNRDMPPARKATMSVALFERIIAQARFFARDVYLHHRGEPLLNPDLFKMIRIAAEAGLRTRFHTNGALLDESKAHALLEAGPDLVSFSVDGFETGVYEKIRVGADMQTTLDNIVRLVELRRSARRRKPYVVVEKIRFRDPQLNGQPEQVAAVRQRLLRAGVEEVIEKEEYEWAAKERTGDAASSRSCTFPWYAMVICADGTVTPCPQDFQADLVMGNAAEQTLAEIWNGEVYRKLRRSFFRGAEHLSVCQACDRLTRKTVGGIPFQYLATFLIDQVVGYNRLRKWLGTSERS